MIQEQLPMYNLSKPTNNLDDLTRTLIEPTDNQNEPTNNHIEPTNNLNEPTNNLNEPINNTHHYHYTIEFRIEGWTLGGIFFIVIVLSFAYAIGNMAASVRH
jgi:hypothetical protein